MLVSDRCPLPPCLEILLRVTPDLETRVDSEALTEARIKSILAENPSWPEGLPVAAAREWTLRVKRRSRPTLYLPTMHDYLGDDADWDARTWVFEPEGRRRLHATMQWLFARIPEALTFQAIWIGDPVEAEPLVQRSELLQMIQADEIGTRVRYRLPADLG